MQAVYLTGESVYLRALTAADAQVASAWFDSPFPINATRAEEFLKEEAHKNPWNRERILLAIVRPDGNEVIGGVSIRSFLRAATLTFHVAPWAEDGDALRADALGLLISWLREELEYILIRTSIPADQTKTIAAAERAGMRLGARLREHIGRGGSRVDLLMYEIADPSMECTDA